MQGNPITTLKSLTELEVCLENCYSYIKDTVADQCNPSINVQQALMLARIPDEGCGVGAFTRQKYYIGTNASYNVGKLVELGYLEMTGDSNDRRRRYVSLSGTGLMVKRQVVVALDQHRQVVPTMAAQ